MVYLDYAAHTPAEPAVIDAFAQAAARYVGNPSSAHRAGFEARARMDKALSAVAGLLGVRPDELIFTSGASESNNLAVKGVARRYGRFGRHIVSTLLEHASVNGPLAYLQNEGFEVDYAPLSDKGSVDLGALRALLRDDTILVCVSAVDSEIGLVQPLADIAAIVHEHPHCHLHVDFTQAVGKLPVSFEGADLGTFSSHKFYGLCGSGVLYRREGVMLEPLIHGGHSTTPFRSGTPALALAVATEAALKTSLGALDERLGRVRVLNAFLRESYAGRPALHINSPEDASPFILNASVAGGRGDALQQFLADNEVCVSTKSACCAPKTPSRPVFALTHDRRAALSTLRVSLSHLTTREELETYLGLLDRFFTAE